MSIRSKGRECRTTLAARIATVCVTAAALVPLAAESASAYVPCPEPIPSAEILNWQYRWPTPEADPKGVTMCEGFGSVLSKGHLQIVDLNDGAKLRLVSQLDPSSPTPGRFEPSTLYQKRTAEDWYSYIRSGAVYSPAPSRLLSTTNASFFKDSDNDNPTTLTFPHRFNLTHETWGRAMWDEWVYPGPRCPDPDAFDYCAAKTLLRIGGPDDQPQKVSITPMFTIYDAVQADGLLRDGHWTLGDPWPVSWDATASFDPLVAVGDESRRNYIGKYNNVVYIFTSVTDYTNAEVNDLMQQIQPGMSVMQLDGGGSAQMHSEYASMDSSIPIFDREVPDVLAVYKAP